MRLFDLGGRTDGRATKEKNDRPWRAAAANSQADAAVQPGSRERRVPLPGGRPRSAPTHGQPTAAATTATPLSGTGFLSLAYRTGKK